MSRGDGKPTMIGDGLRRFIEATHQPIEKSPGLHAIFDRLASSCAEGLRDLFTVPLKLALTAIVGGNVRELLGANETDFGAVFYSREWDARIVIGCDRRFAFSIVEAMYGADGTEPQYESDRQLTILEVKIMKEIASCVAELLSQQLLTLRPTSFDFERAEPAIDFQTLGLGDGSAFLARYSRNDAVDAGNLFVLLPSGALAPFRKALDQDRTVDTKAPDPAWSETMQRELNLAKVEIDATFDGPQLSLAEIGMLRPGQVLLLNSTATAPIALEIEDQTLFMAKLGQSKGSFTVCIERSIDEREELLSSILSEET